MFFSMACPVRFALVMKHILPSATATLAWTRPSPNGSALSRHAYRFAHLDGAWSVSRWNSGFGDGAAVTGGVNEGAKPVAGVSDVAPTFNVGQRVTLRCEVIVGAFDANGVPWARLIQFKAGGVLMFQVGDAAYRGKLIPGVFLYGATARVHAIAGDTPSGLPTFPATVGVNAADDLLPLAGGSTSVLPDPAANIGVNADCDLLRLNSPSSELWNRGGGYDWHFHPIPCGRKDIHFSGHGVIAGTVKEKGQPDQPLVRRVQLISENTRVLVAETWSDTTGAYRFDYIDPAQRYTVVSYDYKQMYRAVVADNLHPETMPCLGCSPARCSRPLDSCLACPASRSTGGQLPPNGGPSSETRCHR